MLKAHTCYRNERAERRLGSTREGRLHDFGAQRSRVHATLTGILDDHRDRDGRTLGRREADEPAVWRARRVLGRAGLARDVDARDPGAEGEGTGPLDRADEVLRDLRGGVRPDDLARRAGRDRADRVT